MYGWLTLAGIAVTAFAWGRMTRRQGAHDARLTAIYFCGLFGALLGAKFAFLACEGWHFRGDWMALLTGRSVTGALLGGYAAVEIGKRALGYERATGDVFAILVPLALMIGRAGCITAGCCPGIECEPAWWSVEDASGAARWPAAAAEGLFNAVFLAWAVAATRFNWQPGNRFHVYLIAYGLFRFGHEFLRDDHRVLGPMTGYHALAIAIAALGAVRYAQRRASSHRASLSLGESAIRPAGVVVASPSRNR